MGPRIFKHARILVVDDEQINVELLRRLLERGGFSRIESTNGTGYVGIAGSAVPLAGRIVAITDVFDALTQTRPYKAAWTVTEAVSEIERQRGRQFDPALVDAFLHRTPRKSGAGHVETVGSCVGGWP